MKRDRRNTFKSISLKEVQLNTYTKHLRSLQPQETVFSHNQTITFTQQISYFLIELSTFMKFMMVVFLPRSSTDYAPRATWFSNARTYETACNFKATKRLLDHNSSDLLETEQNAQVYFSFQTHINHSSDITFSSGKLLNI